MTILFVGYFSISCFTLSNIFGENSETKIRGKKKLKFANNSQVIQHSFGLTTLPPFLSLVPVVQCCLEVWPLAPDIVWKYNWSSSPDGNLSGSIRYPSSALPRLKIPLLLIDPPHFKYQRLPIFKSTHIKEEKILYSFRSPSQELFSSFYSFNLPYFSFFEPPQHLTFHLIHRSTHSSHSSNYSTVTSVSIFLLKPSKHASLSNVQ